jgi:NADP-dependent aldehyde dehydrogenase
MGFEDATKGEIDQALQLSWQAFQVYKEYPLTKRAELMATIAQELNEGAANLIPVAAKETNLDAARLQSELKRTIFQLESYAEACIDGTWLDARIDTADKSKSPVKPDLRKMLIPLGPVIVFGASNFPFAYSTAGGDTACALAAGCSVIVKAHPAHAETSELVAAIIKKALHALNMPEDIFIHIHGTSFEVGKELVEHPLTKAVGFTGSLEGGRALFDIGARRPVPIPVFAEMGSVNPVFLLPGKLKEDAKSIASQLAISINLSAGQFCTNPGILVGIDNESLKNFIEYLALEVEKVPLVKMLHPGIAKSFHEKRNAALQQNEVKVIATAKYEENELQSLPTIATVKATSFLNNPLLHKEVFGTYSLLVKCSDVDEMIEVAKAMEGQLTATIIGTSEEIRDRPQLINTLKERAGRLVMNGVPTGVDVAIGMHHGGPYPATTDSRFTAVGADGIRRFARPVCYQNWENELLPDALKNENPLHIWRTVNNQLTKNPVGRFPE